MTVDAAMAKKKKAWMENDQPPREKIKAAMSEPAPKAKGKGA